MKREESRQISMGENKDISAQTFMHVKALRIEGALIDKEMI